MPATDYAKPGAQRFDFRGICTTRPPDSMPEGKYPMAINVHAYLDDAITPRLPQTAPLVTLVPSAAVHSLRRMNDNTATLSPLAIGPDPVTVGTDIPVGGATAWSNPGNITGEDGSFATVALASPGLPPTNVIKPPTAAVSVVGSGVQWTNPSGIFTGGGSAATTGSLVGSSNVSGWIYAQKFNFAIPANATIVGITAQVSVKADVAGSVTDWRVQLLKAGIVVGANRANGNAWGTTFASQAYGTATDLWGVGLTPSDINNNSFGIAIKCANHAAFFSHTGSIDLVQLNVFYVIPATVQSDFLQGTGFGFAIAGSPVIAGIRVEVKGLQSSSALNGLTVQLMKAGVTVGTAKLNNNLPLTNSFVAFGSNADLWGTAWSAADINNANFGVSLQVSVAGSGTWSVDYVRITIFTFSSSPVTGYVLVSGAADKLYVNNTQVDSGYSQNRLALITFRPDQSVRPWMYVGDLAKMTKVSSDGTIYKQGIKEPQTVPTLALPGAGPLTGDEFYAYSYRSSATGAQSNLSPISPISGANDIVAAANSVDVTCTSSTDPQVDLIDIWRFGVGLLSYTYVGTIPNASPTFHDNLSDVDVENNPVAQFDNFEPFPSIDVPQNGTVVVTNGPYTGTKTLTWASGNKFNVRWLPGTIVTLGTGSGSTQVTLFARPTSTTVMVGIIQPPGAALTNGTYSFSIPRPNLAAQPLPALWGPTDGAAYMFACGDPLRPGTLYFTKGNSPDSAPQTNQIELTSPSEPLIGGAIVGGLAIAFSTERGWLLYPNFAQATATIVGVIGSPFNPVESISERGLWAKEGICTDGGGYVYYIAKDGIRASPGGTGSKSITDDIDNLFPHEGLVQRPYTIAGITISPPDYSNPNAMCLRFSQGYLYFDYIGLDQTYYTLKYHVRKEAWSVETYPAIASVHADNEGQGTVGSPALPAIGVFTGCVDATVRQLSSFANTEVGTMMTILTPSVGGMIRPTKHFGDIYIESSFPNNGTVPQFGVTLWTGRYSVQQDVSVLNPDSLPVPSVYRDGTILELNNGEGLYVKDVGLQITGPVTPPALSGDGTTAVYAALYLWEPTLIEQPETIGQRVTDWDDAGFPGAKLIQGVIIEADTGAAAKNFEVQSGDDESINILSEMGTGRVFNGQTKIAFSLAKPFIAHNMRLVPGDTVPVRLFSVQWVYVPIPESCQEWHTESTGHGLEGWQHIKEINVEHMSTQDFTLTLIADTGAQVTLMVPNSGGTQAKTLLSVPSLWATNPAAPATPVPMSPKFKLLSYNVSAPGEARIWKEDLEVKVKPWGSDGPYQVVKPFGGVSQSGEAEL